MTYILFENISLENNLAENIFTKIIWVEKYYGWKIIYTIILQTKIKCLKIF